MKAKSDDTLAVDGIVWQVRPLSHRRVDQVHLSVFQPDLIGPSSPFYGVLDVSGH